MPPTWSAINGAPTQVHVGAPSLHTLDPERSATHLKDAQSCQSLDSSNPHQRNNTSADLEHDSEPAMTTAFNCPVCNRGFFRDKQMQNHLHNIHQTVMVQHAPEPAGMRPYVCTLCDEGFYETSPMQRHLLKHHHKFTAQHVMEAATSSPVQCVERPCARTGHDSLPTLPGAERLEETPNMYPLPAMLTPDSTENTEDTPLGHQSHGQRSLNAYYAWTTEVGARKQPDPFLHSSDGFLARKTVSQISAGEHQMPQTLLGQGSAEDFLALQRLARVVAEFELSRTEGSIQGSSHSIGRTSADLTRSEVFEQARQLQRTYWQALAMGAESRTVTRMT